MSEDLPGQEVDLRCLVVLLDGPLAEQVVAPGDEGLHVLDEHVLLVGDRAHPRDEVRVEWVVPPLAHLRNGLGIALGDREHDRFDLLSVVVGLGRLVELLGDPVLLLRSSRIRRRGVGAHRVEDVMEPAQRLFEALIGGEAGGDEQRDVEEQLPVIRRVCARVREVNVFDGIGLHDVRGIGLVLGEIKRGRSHRN